MSKELKVCLAMGGGVSLGAFSGAALTEALKLLLINGRDRNGCRYKSVTLDGLSGASAGSISLAILVRVLIDYTPFLKFKSLKKYFSINNDVQDIETFIRDKVAKEYKIAELKARKCDKTKNENKEKKSCEAVEIDKEALLNQLFVLEVAQAIQYSFWVEDLQIEKMIAGKKVQNPEDPFGLLSKEYLFFLVNKYFTEPNKNGIDISKKQLIEDRILMAFSMANLSPLPYSHIGDEKDNKGDLVDVLKQATKIENHSELRVFDLIFNEYQGNAKVKLDDKYITLLEDGILTDIERSYEKKSLQKNESWQEIAVSAMASGAFPLAFEPAILERYTSEYKSKPNSENDSTFVDNLKSTVYAYADGGAFNNEPIKEAFKIGFFQDFQTDVAQIDDNERLVIFVDPSVPDKNRMNQLKSLDPYADITANKRFKNFTEAQKIGQTIADLSSMIIRQSRINEEAKASKFYREAHLKNIVLNYLKESGKFNFTILVKSGLIENFKKTADEYLAGRQLSVGTRQIQDILFRNYSKICHENNDDICLSSQGFKDLLDLLDESTVYLDEARLTSFFELNGCDDQHKHMVARAIFETITEFALNQTGKSEKAERAGIFPVKSTYIGEDTEEDSGKKENDVEEAKEEETSINKVPKAGCGHYTFNVEPLPGSELAAFAGFLHEDARKACFYKGRHDSIMALGETSFRANQYKTLSNPYEKSSGKDNKLSLTKEDHKKTEKEEIHAFIDRSHYNQLHHALNSKFEIHKELYKEYIRDHGEDFVISMVETRLQGIFKSLLNGNRFNLFFSSILPSKSILSRITKKAGISSLLMRKNNNPIKLLVRQNIQVQVWIDKKKVKIKTAKLKNYRSFKLYWYLDEQDKIIFTLDPTRSAFGNNSTQRINYLQLDKKEINIDQLVYAFLPLKEKFYSSINPIFEIISSSATNSLELKYVVIPQPFVEQIRKYLKDFSPVT